ncbi:MAG: ribonuclease PH [Hyphomicrobiales bacterium]
MRPSKRQAPDIRPVSLECGVSKYAEGSCLIRCGDTHVLCSASVIDHVPAWLRGRGQGWITAEYGMLPRSTQERMRREAASGRQSGRTLEIQRLIGRSLRAAVDPVKLGERQIVLDCDVVQADGGTRTAAITGAWVAVHECILGMMMRDMIGENPIRDHVAAISCGLYRDMAICDLDYAEDCEAQADVNFVMTGKGDIVEVQGTAEAEPFSQAAFIALLDLARGGIARLVALQKTAIEQSAKSRGL